MTMKTKKICYNCKSSNNNKKSVVKKKIADWKVKMGLKTHFPNDIIMPLKKRYPRDWDTTYLLKLGKRFANRFVYYYCADKKESKQCLTSFSAEDVYGDGFNNRGVVQCDEHGNAKLKFRCPQAYYVDDKDKLHLPHVHYFISDFKNKKWNEKLFTERIICDVNKQQLTEMIKNKCAVVINALPYQEYMKARIPNSIPIPYDIVVKGEISKKQLVNYLREMLVHYPKINKQVQSGKMKIEHIPMVVYCYYKKCDASMQLIEKMIDMGFVDLKEYSAGIVDWMKK